MHDSTSKVSHSKSHPATAKKAEDKPVDSHHSLDRVSSGHSPQASKAAPSKDKIEHDSKPSKVSGGFLGHLSDALSGRSVDDKLPPAEPKKSMREQFKPSVLEKPKSEGEVSQVLKDNFDRLDTAAGGRKDGVFGSNDLEKVATDPNASPELKAAAEQVLSDPNLYHGIDVADGRNLDDKISAADLDKVIANEKQSGSASGSTAPTFKDLADRLNKSFDTFDSAKNGRKDGKISREDLEIVANDSKKSEEDRTLAKQLLADQTSVDAMDLGAKKGHKDGMISKDDLDEARNAASVDGNSQNTWTADSEKSLDKVLSDPNFKSEDLFKGFSQTNRGNCVSTAIIKGALDHYGKDVFKDVKKGEDGSYSVKLQDGKDVTVTRAELQAAAAGAHFVGTEPDTKAFANLAYAVMAKRAEQEGHEGSKTFGEALVTLSNGENAKKTPEFLGLQDKMKSVPIDEVEGKNGVVAWGDGHCFYVDTINGKTYGDRWGKQSDYDGTNYVTEKEVDGTQKVGKLDSAYIFT